MNFNFGRLAGMILLMLGIIGVCVTPVLHYNGIIKSFYWTLASIAFVIAGSILLKMYPEPSK